MGSPPCGFLVKPKDGENISLEQKPRSYVYSEINLCLKIMIYLMSLFELTNYFGEG